MSRTIVIGDIHGCLDELERLLAECQVRKNDRVISVGDLVAKGPDSAGVVALARERGIEAVLGNHDAHILLVRDIGRKEAEARGRAHHFEVARSLSEDDIGWLKALPLWIRISDETGGVGGVLVVHAGLVPGIPLDRQERNHLLNLRSIRKDGSPSKRIEGTPWAAMWPGPEYVIFGHDAVRGLQRHRHASGLDTGCVYGRELTAMVLPERRLVTVKAKRAYLPFE